MPSFTLSSHTDAPVEEVWKLLHDPRRFPDWWAGIGSVEVDDESSFTLYPEGFPDFPMGQRLRASPGVVTVSCLVSDLEFSWQLAEQGAGTAITVQVRIPDAEAHRLASQRDLLAESIQRLGRLAGDRGTGPGSPSAATGSREPH